MDTKMHKLLIFLLLASFALIANAQVLQQESSGQDANTLVPASAPNLEINGDFLHTLSKSVQQSLDVINNVESLPDCEKLATSALLHECSATDKSGKNSDAGLFIKDSVDIYSARLAICELNGAKFLIPTECKAFVPTKRVKKARSFGDYFTKNGPTEPLDLFQAYDDATEADLRQCVNALGKSSQAWTSFSNSRQNAAFMCRAMRSEIEKDEKLQIAKILADTAVASGATFQEVVNQANEVQARFSDLAKAMPKFQQDLAAGNEQYQQHLKQLWSDVEQVRSGLKGVVGDVSSIRQDTQKAQSDLTNLREELRGSTSEISAALKNSLEPAQRGLEKFVEDVAAMDFSNEAMHQALINGLYQAADSLGLITTQVENLNQQLTTTDEFHMKAFARRLEEENEMQARYNRSMLLADEADEKVEKLKSSIDAVSNIFNIDWPSAVVLLQTTAVFAVYMVMYFLLGYGIWDKYMGFSFLGSVLASLSTGIALAGPTTMLFNPFKLYEILQSMSTAVFDSHFGLGTVLGISISAVIFGVRAMMQYAYPTKDGAGYVEYDPASPPCGKSFV